jgi:hypothetical protein
MIFQYAEDKTVYDCRDRDKSIHQGETELL